MSNYGTRGGTGGGDERQGKSCLMQSTASSVRLLQMGLLTLIDA